MHPNKDLKEDIQQTVKTFFGNYPKRRFEKGEHMLLPQQTLLGIYYMEQGQVTEYDISPSGNKIIVNVFKDQAFFPMSIALNGTPNEYFYEAQTLVLSRVAPVSDVVEFIQKHPDVMFDLLCRVYRGTDGLLRRMAHLMGGTAKTRLLFELLNAGYRFSEKNQNGEVLLLISENDLAKRSGLSRETVNRVMRDLKDRGLVYVQTNGIHIPNLEQLKVTLGPNL